MAPYLILLVFVTITSYFGRRHGDRFIRRVSLFIAGSSLILFAGLRDYLVGTDTGNYVGWMSFFTSIESVLTSPLEKGFSFLVFLSAQLSDNYILLLSFIALLCVVCYLLTIVNLIPKYEIAIFLFITLGSYTFFFNGARQGIATAICFLALPFLLQRKVIPYVLLVLCATLFHKTAIVALPLYYISSKKVGWKQIIIILIAAVILAASISSFASLAATFLDEKYATYGEQKEGGGLIKTLFLSVQGILFILFQRQIDSKNIYYSRLLNIYLIGVVVAISSVIASVNPSGILRLTTYFVDVAIILWPIIFANFKTRKNKYLASIVFLGFTFLYFVLTTSTYSNLVPYRLNSGLF